MIIKLNNFGFEELDIFLNEKFYIFFILVFSYTCSLFANPNIQARTAILFDYHSNDVLYEMDADAQIYPASMTKIMTSIVAFDLLKINYLWTTNLRFLKMHGDYLKQDIHQCS